MELVLPTLPWDVIKILIEGFPLMTLLTLNKQIFEFTIMNRINAIAVTSMIPQYIIANARFIRVTEQNTDSIDLNMFNPIHLQLDKHILGTFDHMTRLTDLSIFSAYGDNLVQLTRLTKLSIQHVGKDLKLPPALECVSLNGAEDVVELPSRVHELSMWFSAFPILTGPLTTLVMAECAIDDDKNALEYTRSLTKLDSKVCEFPRDFFKNMTALTILELETSDVNIGPEIKYIMNMTSLTRLNINEPYVVAPGNFLSNLTALTDLKISLSVNISITGLTNLRRLDIDTNLITDSDLRLNTSLVYLHVNECYNDLLNFSPISNYGLEPLKLLENLQLANNDFVTDEGISHLDRLSRVYKADSRLTESCGDMIQEHRYKLTGSYGPEVRVMYREGYVSTKYHGGDVHSYW